MAIAHLVEALCTLAACVHVRAEDRGLTRGTDKLNTVYNPFEVSLKSVMVNSKQWVTAVEDYEYNCTRCYVLNTFPVYRTLQDLLTLGYRNEGMINCLMTRS